MINLMKDHVVSFLFVAGICAVTMATAVWSPFGTSQAVADSEPAAAPAVVRPTKVLPECFVVADEEAAIEHIRQDGGLGLNLVAHSWENRPPAFRGDDFSVKVQTFVHKQTPGIVGVQDMTITNETEYKWARRLDLFAVERSTLVDTRLGWSTDGWQDGGPARGEEFTGENWRHVVFVHDVEDGIDAALCWHYRRRRNFFHRTHALRPHRRPPALPHRGRAIHRPHRQIICA